MRRSNAVAVVAPINKKQIIGATTATAFDRRIITLHIPLAP